MAFEVQLTATARRDLRRVPARITPAIIAFLYGDLAASPRRVGKPLQRELEGRFSARRGPYRILYLMDGDQVRILRIVDHRSDIYRPG